MLKVFRCVLLAVPFLSMSSHAEELSAIVQAKISIEIEKAKAMAADPVIVRAVKEFNSNKPVQLRALDQMKWQSLSATEPVVTALTLNNAARYMKSHVSDLASEAFVSGADGTKVAFLAKTTNWNHTGAAKHEDAMQGKVWQGKVERDESTDTLQLQVSVPVIDDDKPIGSLVIGLKVRDLNTRRIAAN
jgi:hypothetical protein